MGDHGIVFGNVLPHFVGVAGKIFEDFIADFQVAIVKWMSAHKVLGKWRIFGVVHIQIFLRHCARVVGSHE